jgi:uncharacterized metal-binding protein YceD (DUF177 family)
MSEFPRPVEISRLSAGATVFEVAATPAERVALARRFGLVALDRLEARVTLVSLAGGLLRLAAELSADVHQECVVTLAPVANRIDDRFSLVYRAGTVEDEVVLNGEAELVEPLAGDTVDLGEAVAQQLSLVLDPYPRAPGVEAALPADSAKVSPFSVLVGGKEGR